VTHLRFRYQGVADWPPLAWLARCSRHESEITIYHGDGVDTAPGWFCEAVWAGRYDAGDFDRTDVVFGSGGRTREDRATFVSSASTVDRVHALETASGAWVSNSLACLIAATRASVDPLYPRYFADFRTIRDGLGRYRRSLETTRGPVQLTYYHNLEWDGARLRAISKPHVAHDFASFAKYRSFLAHSLERLADNMATRLRRRPYRFLGTLSSGYDSATVAVLGREAGLSEVITVDRARGGEPDSGAELALRLGLRAHVVRRDAWRDRPFAEIPFIASDAKGEDVYFSGAEDHLAGTVLLSGFHGDQAWARRGRPVNADIVRKDQSGLSLSEYRLWVGFIHCPLPFLGALQLADIGAISRSPELAPWDWPRGHSRPICRRIVEDAGLPRESFGMRKRAASVLLFDEGFLSPASLADYTSWMASRTGDAKRLRARARRDDAARRFYVRLLEPVAALTPRRWTLAHAIVQRLLRAGKREQLFRYVFPWALARAATRYAPAFAATVDGVA